MKHYFRSFRLILASFLILVFSSAGIFSLAEGRPYLDGLWWAYVTAPGVGYGDITPATFAGRFVAYPLLAYGSLLFILPSLVAHIIIRYGHNPDNYSHEEQMHMMEEVEGLGRALLVMANTLGGERLQNRVEATLHNKTLSEDDLT